MERKPKKSLLRLASEGFAVTFTGDLVFRALGIIATFIILVWLAPYEYGVWRLLLGALSAVGLVSLTGITGVLVADVSREIGLGNNARAQAIVWRGSLVLIAGGAIGAVALFAFAPLITAVSGIDLTLYLVWLSGAVFFGSLLQVVNMLFQARLEPARAAILKNIGNIVYLAGLVLFVGLYGYGVLGVVIAYVLSCAVPVLVALPYLLRTLFIAQKQRDIEQYSVKEALWDRGRYALGNDYAGALANALWPWIVGYFLSIETVAYVGLAMVIASQVFSLLPISYVLRAVLSRFSEDVTRMQDWIQRGMRYSLYLHIIAAIVVFGFAVIIFPIFFPSYTTALPLAAALMLSLPFRALALVLTEWFYATHKQKELFIATAVPKFFALAILPLTLPFIGVFGFVLWQIVASDAVMVLRLYYIKKTLHIQTNLRSLLYMDTRDFELLKRGVMQIRNKLSI